MAGGDSGVTLLKAFGEAGLFEEPCGGDFGLAFGGGPVGDGFGGDVERCCYGVEGGGGDDRVFEEGARAAAVSFAVYEEHALAVTDGADSVVDVDGGWGLAGEVAGEVGVGEVGFGGGVEAEADGGDDVAVAVSGVEDASAVGEAALVGGEIDEGGGFEVEGADGGDGVGDLLTVGSYVLNGGAADGAGDAGEALDSGDSLLGDVEDEGVPVAASGDGVVDVTAIGLGLERVCYGDVEDEAVEAGVADKEIAASAEDEDGEVVGAGVGDGFEESGFAGDVGEEVSGAADAEGGVGGERDVLLDVEGGRLHGFEGTTCKGAIADLHRGIRI